MDYKMKVISSILLLLLLKAEISNAFKCSKSCSSPENFLFKTGHYYTYRLQTETVGILSDVQSELKVNADVNISKIDSCEFIIELRNVNILSKDNRLINEISILGSPTRFSYDDGLISHICHDQYEPEWIINFKKAILSSMQISIKDISGERIVRENDIFGNCESKYVTNIANRGIHIYKTRYMYSCEGYKHIVENFMDYFIFEKQPSLKCLHEISFQRILMKVTCHQHLSTLNQFSVFGNLNLQFVESNLLQNNEPNLPEAENDDLVQSSLHFKKPERIPKTFDELKIYVDKLCLNAVNSLKDDAPDLVSQLSKSFANLDYSKIFELWNYLDSMKCDQFKMKSLFIEALLSSKSKSALDLIRNVLMRNKLVSKRQIDDILFSLAFKKNPCGDYLKSVIPYLHLDLSERSLFGITALLQNHLESTHEKDYEIVHQALKIIASNIDPENEEKTLTQIRALGNVHLENSEVVNRLMLLLKLSKNNELKVNILDVIRRINPCQPLFNSESQNIALDESLPMEIRIAAFKINAQCSQNNILHKVKSNDANFAGYVKSYINNYEKSLNRDKQKLAEKIRSWNIDQSFQVEGSSSSKNYEFSHMFRDRQVGINFEVDSIVENGNVAPTWVVLNLTLISDRENYNLIEIGIRQDELWNVKNLSIINWSKKLKNLRFPELLNSLESETVNILKKLSSIIYPNKFSLYFGVNGRILFYKSYSPKKEKFQLPSFPISDLLNFNRDKLLKYSDEIPLISGVTIARIKEVGLVSGVRSNLGEDSKKPHSLYEFYLIPNIVLRGKKKLYITFGGKNFNYWKSKLVSQITMISNVTLRGRMEPMEQSGISFILDLKDEQMDLIRVKLEQYVKSFTGKKEYVLPKMQKLFSYCPNTLQQISGYEICGYVKKSKWPLFDAGISMKKSDFKMKQIKFLTTFGFDEILQKVKFTMLFDSPGSSENRRHLLEIEQNGNRNNFNNVYSLILATPYYHLDMNASLIFNPKSDNIISIDALSNRQQRHAAKIIIKLEKKGTQDTLKSSIKIACPFLSNPHDYDILLIRNINGLKKSYQGEVYANFKQGKKLRIMKFGFIQEGSTKDISIRSINKNNKFTSSFSFQYGSPNIRFYNINSNFISDGFVFFEFIHDFKTPKLGKRHYELRTKLIENLVDDNSNLQWDGEFVSTKKILNSKFDLKLDKKPHGYEIDFNLYRTESSHRLNLHQIFKVNRFNSFKDFSGDTIIKCSYLTKGIDYEINYKLDVKPQMFDSKVNIKNLQQPRQSWSFHHQNSIKYDKEKSLFNVFFEYQCPKMLHLLKGNIEIGDNVYSIDGNFEHSNEEVKLKGYHILGLVKNDPRKMHMSLKVLPFNNISIIDFEGEFEKRSPDLYSLETFTSNKNYYRILEYLNKFQQGRVKLQLEKNNYEIEYTMIMHDILSFSFTTNNNILTSIHFKLDKKNNLGHFGLSSDKYNFSIRAKCEDKWKGQLSWLFNSSKYGINNKLVIDLHNKNNGLQINHSKNNKNIFELVLWSDSEKKRAVIKIGEKFSLEALKTLENDYMRSNRVEFKFKNDLIDNFNLKTFIKKNVSNKNKSGKFLSKDEQISVEAEVHLKEYLFSISSDINQNSARLNLQSNPGPEKNNYFFTLDGKVHETQPSIIEFQSKEYKGFVKYIIKENEHDFDTVIKKNNLDMFVYSSQFQNNKGKSKLNIMINNKHMLFKTYRDLYWIVSNMGIEIKLEDKLTFKIKDNIIYEFESNSVGSFSNDLIRGPHNIISKINANGEEKSFVARYLVKDGQLLANGKLSSPDSEIFGIKVDGKVEGDFSPNSRGSILAKVILASDTIHEFNGNQYNLEYKKQPTEKEFNMIKRSNGKTIFNLTYKCLNNGHIHKLKANLYDRNSKEYILDMGLDRGSKMKFYSKLHEKSKEPEPIISEVLIDIPMESLRNILGNEVVISINLSGKGSKIFAEYNSPTPDNMNFNSGLKIKNEDIFFYKSSLSKVNSPIRREKRSQTGEYMLYKGSLDLLDNPKVYESEIYASTNSFSYSMKALSYQMSLVYEKMNSNYSQISGSICRQNGKEIIGCAHLDYENAIEKGYRSLKGHLSNIKSIKDPISIQYSIKKEDDSFRSQILFDINGRRYGQERYIEKKDKEITRSFKLYLPMRIIHVQVIKRDSEVEVSLWHDYERKPDKKYRVLFQKFYEHTKIVLFHPFFDNPITFIFKPLEKMHYEIKMAYSSDPKQDLKLNLRLKRYTSQNNHYDQASMRISREDGKIDFGFEAQKAYKSTKYSSQIKLFWLNRNGIMKESEFNLELVDKSSGNLMINILNNKIKTGIINLIYNLMFEFNKESKDFLFNMEFDLKNGKKLKIFTNAKPDNETHNNCTSINAEIIPEISSDAKYLFTYCQDFSSKANDLLIHSGLYVKRLVGNEYENRNDFLFDIKRVSNYPRDFLVSIKYDTQVIGSALMNLMDEWAQMNSRANIFIDEIKKELEAKYYLLSNSLATNVVNPIKSHREQLLNEMLDELEPELRFVNKLLMKPHLISKRSTFTQNNFDWEVALNIKFLVFDLETGEIEFIVHDVDVDNILLDLINRLRIAYRLKLLNA